jgi:hypothetical protein
MTESSGDAPQPRQPKVQSPLLVDFALHSLGWKAFQDLCGTVLREVLGQTIQHFLDTNDGGRDGAFAGTWKTKGSEAYAGSFTVQCKFTAKVGKHLRLHELTDELAKAERLASRGDAQTYILMTNASLLGTEEQKIRDKFLSINGINHFAIFGGEWISATIRESSRLRMLVPRIYGLGDLSQILDERACAQATEILSAMGGDLSKFVITDSHRKSTKALVEHGFVLLLGDPASGKSTIAAALAVAAIDEWDCTAFKVGTADEFVRHSNPHEPKQFFWIDDAFGPTQFDSSTAAAWNRVFPHLQAAIRRGARVLFTSRSYIFRSALPSLKSSAFPLLRESQVVINVASLSEGEREHILYNHMKLGHQSRQFRSRIKRFLPKVAKHLNFKPETARRLSDHLFTKKLIVSEDGVDDFVERPVDHLVEVIQSLDGPSRSALALIFMRGGSVPSPLDISAEEMRAAELFGGSIATIRESLNAMNDSLVLQFRESGAAKWKFKHPTVRDAFAAIVAADAELLDVYLNGAPPERMLEEVSCGDLGIHGVKVIVPPDRYDLIIERFDEGRMAANASRAQFLRFLRRRCDTAFLRHYCEGHSGLVESLQVHSYLEALDDVDLIVHLHKEGLLPEAKRRAVIAAMTELAVETPDAGFLDPDCRSLFETGELQATLSRVRNECILELEEVVTRWRNSFTPGDDEDGPEEHFRPLVEALECYQKEFEHDHRATTLISDALKRIETAVDALRSKVRPKDSDDYFISERPSESTSVRSIFDDVDV